LVPKGSHEEHKPTQFVVSMPGMPTIAHREQTQGRQPGDKPGQVDAVKDGLRDGISRLLNLEKSFECGRPPPHIFRYRFVRLPRFDH
jgi:hypothetical protein